MDAHSFLLSIHTYVYGTHLQYVQMFCSHTISQGPPLPPHLCTATCKLHQLHACREHQWQCTLMNPPTCVCNCKLWAGEVYKRAGSHQPHTNVHALQLFVLECLQSPKTRPLSCHPLHHEVTCSHLRTQLAGWREQEATNTSTVLPLMSHNARLPYPMPFLMYK